MLEKKSEIRGNAREGAEVIMNKPIWMFVEDIRKVSSRIMKWDQA